MAAGDIKLVYPADAQVTFAVEGLATSSTLVAGYESAIVDNTSNLYLDILLSGKFTTGTSPTAGTIELWVIAPIDDAPEWPNVFDGTTGAETVTSRDILAACGKLAVSIPTSTTNDQAYPFNAGSVAALFGGILPPKFVLFLTHNTGVNLNATGSNHEVTVQGVYENVAAA